MPDNDKGAVVRLRPTRPCPMCGQPSDRKYYPFCSERCQNRDLGKWLSGNYAIPAAADDESEDSGGNSDGEG